MVVATEEKFSIEEEMDFTNFTSFTEGEVEQLIEKYKYLVPITISKRFNAEGFLKYHGLGKEDLVQFGMIGLSVAINTYDPNRGAKLKSHIISCIYRYIIDYSQKDSLYNKNNYSYDLIKTVSLDTEKSDEGDSYSRDAIESEYLKDNGFIRESEINIMFERLEGILPEKVMKIIGLRLRGYSNLEVSEMEGVTRQAVQRMLKRHKRYILNAIYE